jgi:hypothetical protein
MDAISEIGYPIPKSAGVLHARPRRLKLSVLSLLTVQPCPIQRPVYGCGHRLLVKRAAQELVYPPGSRLWATSASARCSAALAVINSSRGALAVIKQSPK